MKNKAEIVFEEIINDIMYVFPESSRSTAEHSAVTFIRNPNLLIELGKLVKNKRINEASKNY